ncbi:MAG: class II fructose-bisphosphate aldolase [bacterium]|nr:class II fructose-bisphosphate aldolase [bacterium]
MSLKEILQRAAREKWAVPHFNFSNLETLKAIAEAARETKSPVLAGTSEGERNFIGLREAVALVGSFRKEGIMVFLNADHTKSVEAAKKAVEAGYDSVHIDLSAKSLEENISGTKEIVEYAREKSPDISVEGELGYLRGESQVRAEKVEVSLEDYTKPEEAAEFAAKTGVDRLAIAVGNIHGITLDEPALDIERIRDIRQAVPENVILVLHAGSGVPDEEIRAAIAAGISNIHISTELRAEFREELEKSLHKKGEAEYAPYKIMSPVVAAIKEKAIEKIKLFGSENKI